MSSIEFKLNPNLGIPVYTQIMQQVRRAMRLGFLLLGDQLPTVKEVVGQIPVNPNTVLKAYRELEMEGLVETRQGQGTFIIKDLVDPAISHHRKLREKFIAWVSECRQTGLSDESIEALVASVFQDKDLVEQYAQRN